MRTGSDFINIKNCICLALKNIRTAYKTTIKVISAFTVATVCIICFFSYILSVNSQIDDMTNNMASYNYIGTSDFNSISKIIGTHKNITEVKQISQVQLDDDIVSMNIDNVIMKIGNNAFKGINDYSNYFQVDFSYATPKSVYSVCFNIDAYNDDYSVFTVSDLKEFNSKFDKSNYILCGNMINAPKQFVISDYMLEHFGVLKENFNKLIGKQISFYIKNTENPIIENYILVGIIDSDIFYTSCNRENAQIIISDKNTEQKYDNENHYVRYYTSNFRNTSKLSVAFSNENISYDFNPYVNNYDSIEKQQSITYDLIYVVIIFLITALSISIITVMYFYNTEKTKYSAMMLAIGLNQRKLFFMQIFEVIIDGIFAMLIGGILSAVLVALFNLYFSNTIGIVLVFGTIRLIVLSLIVLTYIIVLSLVVSLINLVKFRKYTLSEILK